MIQHGMNLREAVKEAQRLGCEVYHGKSDGHIVFKHPRATPPKMVQNDRRKDATTHTTHWLRKLERALTS